MCVGVRLPGSFTSLSHPQDIQFPGNDDKKCSVCLQSDIRGLFAHSSNECRTFLCARLKSELNSSACEQDSVRQDPDRKMEF